MRLPGAVEQASSTPPELSRSAFLRRGAVAAGAVAGLRLADPRWARAAALATPDAKPIPGGFSASFQQVPKGAAVHVLQPAHGAELNTIGDFKGFVAATEVQGLARGTDGSLHSFDCDLRFMQGSYVALDGQLRHGTFGFI